MADGGLRDAIGSRKRKYSQRFDDLVTYAILVTTAVLIAFPFYLVVTTSLKSTQEANQFPPTLFPHELTLSPYINALQTGPWGQWFLNTSLIAAGATIGVLIIATPAGYVLSRREFRGSTVFFGIFLSTMMIPPQVVILPLFSMFSQVGLVDSRIGLVLCYMLLFTGFAVFLLNGFFKNLPTNLEDAARISGISDWKIFLRVILPLARPGLATAGLFVFVFSWNEFLFALIFLQSEANYTISLGLSQFQGLRGGVVLNQLMAVSTLAVIPLLLLFAIAQEQFIQGIAGGFGD